MNKKLISFVNSALISTCTLQVLSFRNCISNGILKNTSFGRTVHCNHCRKNCIQGTLTMTDAVTALVLGVVIFLFFLLILCIVCISSKEDACISNSEHSPAENSSTACLPCCLITTECCRIFVECAQ